MTVHLVINRRHFLKAAGAALVVGWPRADAGPAPDARAASTPYPLNGWIEIDTSGKVTLTTHKAEMGQGVFTAIPQLLAEELEVDFDAVRVAFAPFAPESYGSQVTGGSTSIRANWETLLRAGATARDLLVRAAARRFDVAPDTCVALRGRVHHPATGRVAEYGTLVAEASRLTPSPNVRLKARRDHRLVGRAVSRLDTRAKADGSAIFGVDVRLPGMLYATVERSTRFLGRVVDVDAAAALRVPGVTHVLPVERDVFGHARDGVAVVATSTWSALQGRRALRVRWDDTGFVHADSELLRRQRLAALDGPLHEARSTGDMDAAFAAADAIVDATYETPYQAHACLEPMNCTARVTHERVDIWGPLQAPDWVLDALVRRLGRPASHFHFHPTFLGGGFGRKALADYPSEAVLLARQLDAPVQVLWTREDDLALGPFRPAVTYRLRAALRGARIHALESLAAGQNIAHQIVGADVTRPNASLREGFPEPFLHGIPHQRWADASLAAAVPVVWWRSVYASTNAFAFESFLDELAIAANVDPLAFRHRHFTGAAAARHRRLVDELAARSGWRATRGDDRRLGWGASVVEAFASIVGQVVAVSRGDDEEIRIERICVVVDCGWIVNPDIVRAQIEGSVVMAWGAAVLHESRFADGRAVATGFADYPLPTIRDLPPLDIHLLDSDAPPGGVGEPAVPGFAPALANAVFDLTGRRERRLPLALRPRPDTRTQEHR